MNRYGLYGVVAIAAIAFTTGFAVTFGALVLWAENKWRQAR